MRILTGIHKNFCGRLLCAVDIVITIHNDLLTHWRHIPMDQFHASIFWYQLLPTTYGPQKFAKIGVLKVNYFHLPRKKITQNWNHGSIFMLQLFFINKIKNLRQFQEKSLQKLALNHVIWYINQFSHWYTTKTLLFIS